VHSFTEMLHWTDARERVCSLGRGRRAAFSRTRFQEWKKRRAGYCWSRKASGGVSAWGSGCRPRNSGPQGAAPARLVEVDRLPSRVDGGSVRIASNSGERGVVVR
jgi:hypothetical protein